VSGPKEATRQVLTGSAVRTDNMMAFAAAALTLLADLLEADADPA
jgi:hypothetical protein